MEKVTVTSRHILKFFWKYLRQYPLAFTVVLGASIAASIVGVIVPLYYKKFFDYLENSDALTALEVSVVLSPLIFAFVLKGIEWCFDRISSFTNGWFQSKAMTAILHDAFDTLLGHSYTFFTDSFTGGLTRKVNRLPHAFGAIIDQCVYVFLPIIISILGILYVVFTRSMLIGEIFLIGFAIFIYANYKVVAWKQKYEEKRTKADTDLSGALSDSVTNIMTVKLFSAASHEQGIVGEFSKVLESLRRFTWGINETIRSIQGLFTLAIEVAVMIGAFTLYRRGVLSLGDFFLFQSYIMTLASHICGLSWVLKAIYDAFADSKEMIEIIETPYDVADKEGAIPLAITHGKIEFENVDFSFNVNRQIFTDFKLAIEPGEKVAFVGPSGAGKSTITKLLFRFYDVKSGTVKIDGQDIFGVTQESLRNAISLVPQEPILFHRTLMENIRYGYRDATEAEVIETAKKAHCHEFISQLPDGYNTYVGERGIKLSGGERQRIAIARAILKNAPILVLDEATSSLDSESESLIQDALEQLMEGKTTLVIAHRLSTIMKMDRIIVVEKGQVRASGTHEQLLQEDDLYRKLWTIQAGGFIAE